MGDYPEKIDIDDLPESQREIAECIGISEYNKLLEYSGGCNLYIHQRGRLAKKQRNKRIANDFNKGIPVRILAIKYNLSDVRIRQIIKKRK